jgi:hypothetical protein
MLPLLLDLRGRQLEGFSPLFNWSYGLSIKSESSEVVSPGDWLVSSIWFLLSTGQVVIRTWGKSLPVCVRWFNLLFSPGSSCVALQLQHCLVSSSPSKVGQFHFEYCPLSHETSSVIHQGPALGDWLVSPPPLSAFVPHPTSASWKFSSSGCWLFTHPHSQSLFLVLPSFAESLAPYPTPILQGRFSIPLSHTHCLC